MTLASIDVGKLLELVWAAALAGVFVSAAYALLLLGVARASDARRDDRGVALVGFSLLALLAAVAFVGAVAFGVSVIVSK